MKKLAGGITDCNLLFSCVNIWITYISIKSGDRYTRQVLTQSQQQYESTTVPFKRGDIWIEMVHFATSVESL